MFWMTSQAYTRCSSINTSEPVAMELIIFLIYSFLKNLFLLFEISQNYSNALPFSGFKITQVFSKESLNINIIFTRHVPLCPSSLTPPKPPLSAHLHTGQPDRMKW